LGNRPSGFAGAVGNFDIAAEAAPAETAAGDPVTLKLKVTGSGNFDRVTAPALEKNNAWKIYKPTAKFEPEDDSACSGAKTFEQALVPTRSGKLEIPALAFSFFDPEKHQYVTRTTTPLTIKVASGQVPSGQTGSPSAATSAAEPFPEPKGPAPIPNKPSRIRFSSTIRPWLLNPWIPAGAFLLAILVFATHRLIRRRQRLASDPALLRLAAARHSVQAQLSNMENAVLQDSAADFLIAARTAFQIVLGLRWNLPPQTITLAEVNARMNGEAEGFRFIFELADEVAYTGCTFPGANLRQWSAKATAELKRLEIP